MWVLCHLKVRCLGLSIEIGRRLYFEILRRFGASIFSKHLGTTLSYSHKKTMIRMELTWVGACATSSEYIEGTLYAKGNHLYRDGMFKQTNRNQ